MAKAPWSEEAVLKELREDGFEQLPAESFAELTCRAFGITASEFKAELAARPSGQPVESYRY